MSLITENIPDQDQIHRLIDYPNKYDESSNFIWDAVFQFPKGESESVTWSKYAPTQDAVHAFGIKWEDHKKISKPDARYVGFISSLVADVRDIRTKPGHGFLVLHAPIEGVQHAEITYKPNGTLSRSEKNELKIALRNVFGPLIRRF